MQNQHLNNYQQNLIQAITHTLDLIAGANELLAVLHINKEKENSLMIRQQEHLRDRLVKTYQEQRKKLEDSLHLMEF
jgi:hypothetical protein